MIRTVQMVDPLVSVVTPCHNAAPFVGETIESVLRQGYPEVEHLIIDDASTDGSWSVIQRYVQARPDRVRAEQLTQNRGGCHARNRGAALARGEFLMFLDADDLIAPDTLASLVGVVKEQPNTIAACSWSDLQQDGDEWLELPGRAPEIGEDHLADWLDGRGAPPCSVLWRRDAYLLAGGWDEALTYDQDSDVMHRALARGARLVLSRGGRGYYRRHGVSRASVSTRISEDKMYSRMRVLETLESELMAQGRLPSYVRRLGECYRGLALTGFQQGFATPARECLRRAERYGAKKALSGKLLGRILEQVLGMERKEQLVQRLARFGVMTPDRRSAFERQQLLRQRNIHP